MPGHVKLGATGEPDPDPLPYLVVTMDMKRADMAKPYDSKKSVWVPHENKENGFIEGLLESDDGKKAVVMCGHEVNSFNSFNCLAKFFIVYNRLQNNHVETSSFYRKGHSRVSRLDKSIHQSLRNARIWLT